MVGGLEIKLELAETKDVEAALDRVTEKLRAVVVAANEAKEAIAALAGVPSISFVDAINREIRDGHTIERKGG